MNSALLVIDMINDFLEEGAVLEVPMGRKIIPRIIEEIDIAHKEGRLIYFLSDAHFQADKEFDYWPEHALYYKRGSQIIDAIKWSGRVECIVRGYAHKIGKRSYSGFLHTELGNILKSRGIKKVSIVGILTNVCVFVTAIEAQMRGFDVRIIRDGVAALTQEENDRALEQLEQVFKVKVI